MIEKFFGKSDFRIVKISKNAYFRGIMRSMKIIFKNLRKLVQNRSRYLGLVSKEEEEEEEEEEEKR